MAEYGASRAEAWLRWPLPAALALMPAALERHGKQPAGPSAELQAFIAATKPCPE